MRNTAFFLILLALISCKDNSKPIVKSASTKKHKGVSIPTVREGIEGFYTGTFEAVKYDESKEWLNNKITICIDSLDDSKAYGHSIVAGIERPFSGNYQKHDDNYTIDGIEPGDQKYDGKFEITILPASNKLQGSWVANNTNISVTERKFDLEKREYSYNPSLQLPEALIGEPIYGSYKNDDEAEAINKEGVKLNASTTLLQSKDVENLYKGDLEVIRNTIYARHGYSFKNPRMRTLFDGNVDWYMPVSTDVTPLLTETELKNIALIKRYEGHATKYYDSFGR